MSEFGKEALYSALKNRVDTIELCPVFRGSYFVAWKLAADEDGLLRLYDEGYTIMVGGLKYGKCFAEDEKRDE